MFTSATIPGLMSVPRIGTSAGSREDKSMTEIKKKPRRPTSSKTIKEKGRRLQQEVQNTLRALAEELSLGLHDDDIVSREMGQPGVDIRLTPAATRELGLLEFECKNTEKFNDIEVYNKHAATYRGTSGMKIVVHTRNGKGNVSNPRLVQIDMSDFISLLRDRILLRRLQNETYEPTRYFDAEGRVTKTI